MQVKHFGQASKLRKAFLIRTKGAKQSIFHVIKVLRNEFRSEQAGYNNRRFIDGVT